jgi:hypothetical protein
MTKYLLGVYHGDELPPAEELEPIMRAVDEWTQRAKDAGAWVFDAGLAPASTATVVRGTSGGDVLLTDGPYLEGKEHIGGFTIIEAPDLDAALEWGRGLAEATTLPIEVRPFHPDHQG